MEFLEPYGMTQKELAERIGVSYPRVNELIKGKRGMTTDTAVRLARLFGTSGVFWMNLQLSWDLYVAYERADDEEIKRIVPLDAAVNAPL